jgi:hypothetical protein
LLKAFGDEGCGASAVATLLAGGSGFLLLCHLLLSVADLVRKKWLMKMSYCPPRKSLIGC